VTLTYDLLHPRCCDTKGIYHNMCLPELVKICQILSRYLNKRDFVLPISALYDLGFCFDLLTHKVALAHGPFVLIGIKTGSFVFKISCSQVWYQTYDGRMDNLRT